MKAQSEVFGLLFIVMLILVGFLVFITLAPSRKPTSFIATDYEKTQMATNFIDAVLHVSTGCSSQDLSTALMTCETGISGSLTCNSGRTPCEEAKHILELALNKTLKLKGYKYQLNFSVSHANVIFSIPNSSLDCIERVRPGIFPFQSPLTGRMLELRLDICSEWE